MSGVAAVGSSAKAYITVRDLTMAYGSFVIMRDMAFTINQGDVFIIMGGSGSGKSTLLRHLIGLNQPAGGEIFYGNQDFTRADAIQREQILRGAGVLFQSGALWSPMTLDPGILFLDEPSSGLDPISARLLDELILDLRNSLGTTVVVVTHDLASIFTIGTNSIFLDADRKTISAQGPPKELLAHTQDPQLRNFLTRGRTEHL